jgi:hypothetical protein
MTEETADPAKTAGAKSTDAGGMGQKPMAKKMKKSKKRCKATGLSIVKRAAMHYAGRPLCIAVLLINLAELLFQFESQRFQALPRYVVRLPG